MRYVLSALIGAAVVAMLTGARVDASAPGCAPSGYVNPAMTAYARATPTIRPTAVRAYP